MNEEIAVRSIFAGFSLVAALIFAISGGVDARDASAQEQRRWQLDIPSQPVDEAIYRLGAVSGVQIFADGKAVAGRKSKVISGEYTAEEALRHLLAGTGLVARSAGPGAMMVTLGLVGLEGEMVRQNYSIALQRAAVAALCRHGGESLGQYRLALRMWIAEQGYPERIDLLSSTGDEERDSRIRRALLTMSTEEPPLALPQPVVMVILPRTLQESGDCSATTTRIGGYR